MIARYVWARLLRDVSRRCKDVVEPLICFCHELDRTTNPLMFTLTLEISESLGPFPDNTVCLCSFPAGIETSFNSKKGQCCALREVPAADPIKPVQLAAETQSDLVNMVQLLALFCVIKIFIYIK